MADPHPTPRPWLGRGRGSGIRINSHTPTFTTPIPTSVQINKHTSSLKEFFSARKARTSSRHKIPFNLNSLRTLPHRIHSFSSQNFQSSKIMPSPTTAATPSQDATPSVDPSQSTLTSWIPVPARKSKRPVLTQPAPNASNLSSTDSNPFDVLSDDEDDPNVLTDMSPVDFQSDDQTTKPPRSSKKKKKNLLRKPSRNAVSLRVVEFSLLIHRWNQMITFLRNVLLALRFRQLRNNSLTMILFHPVLTVRWSLKVNLLLFQTHLVTLLIPIWKNPTPSSKMLIFARSATKHPRLVFPIKRTPFLRGKL